MTELKFSSRLLIVIAVSGLAVGIITGLVLGWLVWPVQVANVDVPDLNASSQDEMIVLVANTYALDHNLPQAKTRLAQLNDPKINDRLATLTKKYNTQKNPDAANLALLAVALGNTDRQIALIATTPTPTATNTATPTDTPTITPTFTATPETPTLTPTSTMTPTRTATRRPVATATLKPAPIAPTAWLPSFPGEWPPGAKFEPVNVAPGQKYWHLARALYCDDRDTRNDCPNLPGGDTGTNIYVMLIGAGGWRESSPLKIIKDDGSIATVDDLGPEKPANDMCNCNYSFIANHWPVMVGGAYPSDKISGLGLYSVRMKIQNAHTRYYLTFQLVTK